jgi:acyl-homoserine-lactone acylase
MTLFTAWLYEADRATDVPYPPPPDAEIDRTVKLDALELLAAVTRDLEAAFGTASVTYGDVHRIRRGAVDLPVGGGEWFVETLHLNSSDLVDGSAGYAWSGSSYLMLTELAPDRVRALSLKPWGQSDDPSSPHYADLTVEYANERFKELWFDRADVEAHARSRTVLTYLP